MHPERSSERADHSVRVDYRREVDEPNAVGEFSENFGRDMHGETRLADATDTGQRDDAVFVYTLHELRNLIVATDQLAHLNRQVRSERVDRPQSAKGPVVHLEQPLRRHQVAQTMLPQIDPQHRRVAQAARRGRGENLPAVADRHDAGGAIHRRPEIVAVALLHLTGMHAHPHSNQRMVSERCLRLDRSIDRIMGPRKRRREPIAARGEHVAAVRVDRGSNERVVLRQREAHLVGPLLPQARRTLDVGEQERDRASGRLHQHDATDARHTPPLTSHVRKARPAVRAPEGSRYRAAASATAVADELSQLEPFGNHMPVRRGRLPRWGVRVIMRLLPSRSRQCGSRNRLVPCRRDRCPRPYGVRFR